MTNSLKESINFFGTEVSFETGKYAKQADGSILCRYGDTVLLATVVASKEEIKEDLDFFPLTVDYIEKFYAAGRFPGGFLKRENRPSDNEKLIARTIDRPIRPMFPKWFKNETQVLVTLLSYDEKHETETIAVSAASAALMISEIPFDGPVAACKVIKKDGEYIINPDVDNQNEVKLNITVAGNKEAILMVEGEAQEASEEEIIEALKKAHEAIIPLIEAQEKLAKSVAPTKRAEIEIIKDDNLRIFVENNVTELIDKALTIKEKLPRYAFIKTAKEQLVEKVLKETENDNCEFLDIESPEKIAKRAKSIFEDVLKVEMRKMIVEQNKRIDGRPTDKVRPIWIETGILPRVHGSAVFTRGETQSLGTVTLGIATDAQKVDTVTETDTKTFMLHYNFPSFSVGEVGRLKAPGRRELGHGNLAERALKPVIPSKDDFAYTIRVVSEILESNGSSSQATVCSGSLALMDAGIPIKTHVAGIAMGLIKENDTFTILTDIMGDEDHLGDMDFKVAGTKDGINAIQMDIKIQGIPEQVMEKAMYQAKEGRMHILEEMEKAISKPRTELNPYAPKLKKMNIPVDKIRDLIGTGGKNIRSIIDLTGADVAVEQDGSIVIAAKDSETLEQTVAMIHGFTDDLEIGKVYEGLVTRIEDYGAFVEVLPGKTGLLHISSIAEERINNVTDFVNLGDKVKVILVGIEFGGKFKLSMKPSDFTKDFSQVKPEKNSRNSRNDRHSHDRKRY